MADRNSEFATGHGGASETPPAAPEKSAPLLDPRPVGDNEYAHPETGFILSKDTQDEGWKGLRIPAHLVGQTSARIVATGGGTTSSNIVEEGIREMSPEEIAERQKAVAERQTGSGGAGAAPRASKAPKSTIESTVARLKRNAVPDKSGKLNVKPEIGSRQLLVNLAADHKALNSHVGEALASIGKNVELSSSHVQGLMSAKRHLETAGSHITGLAAAVSGGNSTSLTYGYAAAAATSIHLANAALRGTDAPSGLDPERTREQHLVANAQNQLLGSGRVSMATDRSTGEGRVVFTPRVKQAEVIAMKGAGTKVPKKGGKKGEMVDLAPTSKGVMVPRKDIEIQAAMNADQDPDAAKKVTNPGGTPRNITDVPAEMNTNPQVGNESWEFGDKLVPGTDVRVRDTVNAEGKPTWKTNPRTPDTVENAADPIKVNQSFGGGSQLSTERAALQGLTVTKGADGKPRVVDVRAKNPTRQADVDAREAENTAAQTLGQTALKRAAETTSQSRKDARAKARQSARAESRATQMSKMKAAQAALDARTPEQKAKAAEVTAAEAGRQAEAAAAAARAKSEAKVASDAKRRATTKANREAKQRDRANSAKTQQGATTSSDATKATARTRTGGARSTAVIAAEAAANAKSQGKFDRSVARTAPLTDAKKEQQARKLREKMRKEESARLKAEREAK